jgi:4-amino-4-deoxy-L-arabinose transferase and related glycosyltransferases of PMT family
MDQPLSQESNRLSTTFVVFEPRRSLSSLLTFARTHAAELVSGALLAIMSLQMFAVIWRKSITVDEIVMIPSAYYHLVDADFQLVNEHPALPKILAALPLLFVQPNETAWDPTSSKTVEDFKWERMNRFWDLNGNKFQSISFWARVPMILLTVGLGILIFLFARTLFGPRTAVLAVALFSLEPTILGHGRVVQTDGPAAFGYLLFFLALYFYTSETTWRRAVCLGAAVGIAVLTKYSMLLVGLVLAPTLVVLWWRSSWRRVIPLQTIIIALTMLVVINAAYYFKLPALTDDDYRWLAVNFRSHAQGVTTLIQSLSYIVPKEFLLGICFQIVHNRNGHSASLLGMYSQTGWWYYFPVALLLKTTIPLLLMSFVSVFWAVVRMIRHRDLRFMWLLIPAAVYMIFVLFSNIDIGVRYMLPLLPFIIILCAWMLDELLKMKGRTVGIAAMVLLLGWTVIEAMRAYPNHIVYMNQFASRAPHWWYLSDSNVEWGDDLHELAQYLKERGERRVLDATLGGFGILPFYGIECGDALDKQRDKSQDPTYIAVGASYLNGSTIPEGPTGSGRDTVTSRVNFFDEYRHRQPEAIIGGSIYVFRVR